MAYDGTAYKGYQRQKNGYTVQEAVEAALSIVTQQPLTIAAAGRTDAGVHASGQVIAFTTGWAHSPEALQMATNVELPDDVALQYVEETTDDFQPRFDARARTYQYRLFHAAVRDPLRERFAWRITHAVDAVDIQAAVRQSLIGSRDFRAFGDSPSGRHTVRHIQRAQFVVATERTYLLEITANAFLNRMVRRIVGTLYEVGQGRMKLSEFEKMIDRGERQHTALAPPHGLTLTSVTYGEIKERTT